MGQRLSRSATEERLMPEAARQRYQQLRLKPKSMWVPGYLYKFKGRDIAERSMLSDMVRIRYCRRLRYLFT